jgi:RNA polymerase sigma factor (TIGR02999 family)
MGRGEDIVHMLQELRRGERSALDRLLPLVYDELRLLARRSRYRWSGEPAPGTESLVHEAYVKLAQQTRTDWANRAQFFYVASLAMRSILIDNARRHGRQKRGGQARAVSLEDVPLVSRQRAEELLALDEALERLEAEDERLVRIVECRFFGGLTVEETAAATGLSPATVKRGWDDARTRLYRDLGGPAAR